MSDEYEMQPAPQAHYPAAQPQTNPFGGGGRALAPQVNAGAVAIESERAIAEARGQIQVAQMFPRDVYAARAELMAECDVPEFAAVAFYNVPRAGQVITGPSIRLAEACASAYGHMEWGHRELSRGEGRSEVEIYAWDKQKNNRRIRQITVDHFRDTRNGPQKLRDSKDIDDKIANVASKQMRGAILALVPKSFTEAAIARCRATIAGGGGVPLKVRIERMTDAFSKLGVNAEVLKKHLKKPLDQINGDDLVDLTAIHASIKNGDKIADHFGVEDAEAEAASTVAAVVDAGKALVADATPKAAAAPAAPAAGEAKAQAPAAAPRAARKAQQAAAAPAEQPKAGPQAQPEPQTQAQGVEPADNGPPASDDPGPGPGDTGPTADPRHPDADPRDFF